MIGSAKSDIIVHFLNSILLHFYKLHTQIYVLAKFELRILKAFEVTALKSSSNRKIDLYSKHRGNKLQALPKMNVTCEWSKVATQILYHHACHELKKWINGYVISFTALHHHKLS